MMNMSIALVSPSGTFTEAILSSAMDRAISLGITITKPTEVRRGCPEFQNGSWQDRLKELEAAEQQKVDGIWCVRGGVGAIELWHRYYQSFFSDSRAPLIGYSDITIYHFLRFLRAKRIGIHGPVFFDITETDPAHLEALSLLILGHAEKLIYPALNLVTHSLLSTITGEIVPMNLASLQSIVGCFDSEFLSGKILALEDVNEPRYKIFRMMQQLKNSRCLAGLKALVIGYLGEERDRIMAETIVPIAEEEGIPLFDWPIFGHARPNWPLLFGAQVTITRIDDRFFTLAYNEQHDHRPITNEKA